MYIDIDIHDDVKGDLYIDNSFINKFKNFLFSLNEKYIENEEDQQKYENSINSVIELLKKVGINKEIDDIEIYVDSINLDDDVIPEKDNYNEGYQDGIDSVSVKQKALRDIDEIHKLEKIAYNFGNQEEITRADCRKICDILGI